ncbi:MAG: response regulator [bacterium]|nr:response regulator [bacterium]
MDKRPKILVVDDEPSNIFLYEGILEKEGYRVTSAANGGEALEKMAADLPDLVLTDLLMPGVHGFDLVKEIKNRDPFKHIPVIITTAVYRGPINQMEARKMGADGFLEKPVDPDVLMAEIKQLLGEEKI